MHHYRLLALLALCGGSLFAQSEAETILKEVRDMPSTPATASQFVFGRAAAPARQAPPTIAPIFNIFTVLGDNVANSGVPCFNCVSGALGNTVGLVAPDGYLHANASNVYVFNNYYWDETYTGTCAFTFLIRDQAKKYVLKVGPFNFAANPSSGAITSTSSTLPSNSAAVGNGLALTVIVCGSSTTVSAMPLYIAFP